MSTYIIRPILPEDNTAIASIIRQVMPEFGAVGEGFAIVDPEVDDMYTAYSQPNAIFYVVEENGVVKGGGGISQLSGTKDTVCELRKMYFLSELRGLGLGKKIISLCLADAKRFGYHVCYLETIPRMVQAVNLYKKMGFEKLSGPMGNTGHHKCNAWFAKSL